MEPTLNYSKIASRKLLPLGCIALLAAIGLFGCTQQLPSAPSLGAAPPASVSFSDRKFLFERPQPAVLNQPAVPFDDAVLRAANTLFSQAEAQAAAGTRRAVVIDPLIDGVTGFQATATRSMQTRIVELARERYPSFDVRPFTSASIAESPLVLIGSLAGIDKNGRTTSARETYRVWLVLADLATGEIVGKATSRATLDGVDLTPTAFFNDSPGWTKDRYISAYLATCAGMVGDPIDEVYLDGIQAAALLGDAAEAYNAGDFAQALDLYESASRTPAGDQLRVYNGLYLANWRLGREGEAAQAFGNLVDFGLRNELLAVRFLFNPGSTVFGPAELARPYPIWIEQLAQRTARAPRCLEVKGHTSASGPAVLNERLSVARAEYVSSRLGREAPPLEQRLMATGVGSRENIIGTGTDDATDALDRRVEFKPLSCPA